MRTSIFTALVCAILLQACKQPETENTDGPLIVVTTGMVADATRHIAGPDARVEALMGPGVDPHLYKATQGDLVLLRKADIIIYNGLHLEGKMQEIFDQLAETKPVYAMGAGIPPQNLLDANGPQQKNYDPHIWFDVGIWAGAVQKLGYFLSSNMPEHSDSLILRTAAYTDTLLALHREISQTLQDVPANKRTIITSHDAFRYFGRAYQFKVVGLQGISTAAEFGLKDVTDMVDLIIAEGIPAVFVESSVSEKSIRSVMDGCAAKGHPIQLGGTLYSDAMGAADTPEGSYTGMVRSNVQTLVNALTRKP